MTNYQKLVNIICEYGSLEHPKALEEIAKMSANNPKALEEIGTVILKNNGFNENGVSITESNTQEYQDQQKFEKSVVLYGIKKPKGAKIYRPPVPLTLEEKMKKLMNA
ncbi:MAG: hypothetical protein UT05_C0001G0120 [Parcubacteria group bacterium GW2011_GWF2_38_76]|nr:MAG: hypothetical protein UT05_C0001G0120 [Parcubacteria group bacterium GW2011_GWF2_38_76]HBM45904.1 hypothetical protein [Patescibacteria group bacterium]